MSDFNLEWLEKNWSEQSIVLYNIGCADLTDDSLRFQITLPRSQVFSFECSERWRQGNLDKSRWYNLHYLHSAVSCSDGRQNFVEGFHEFSGTLTQREHLDSHRKWQEERWVDVITINTFCRSNPAPDILHIDAEGEEYNILKGCDDHLWPGVIWLENNHFYNDDKHQLTVSFDQLWQSIIDRGYIGQKCQYDSIFIRSETDCSPYEQQIPSAVWSSHERKIQQNIWLLRYQLCKQPDWPDCSTVEDFYNLPDYCQQICRDSFDLEPISNFFNS